MNEILNLNQLSTQEILANFQIDPQNGFLAPSPPLRRLHDEFKDWEVLADDFSDLLNAGKFRLFAKRLPLLNIDGLSSVEELERAMLLLSCFAHGYVWQDYLGTNHIPPGIAVPWVQVAAKLGRPPILTHGSLVLRNWRFIDQENDTKPENLATLMQFHGGMDESWFYMLTAAMEFLGGKLAKKGIQLHQAALAKDHTLMVQMLKEVHRIIIRLRDLMAHMPEKCDPFIFYQRVRPFLNSFKDIHYQGVTEDPIHSYHGGSAAQSSLIQMLDALLGVVHKDSHTQGFLNTMRDYMPPKHAAFIRWLEKESQVKVVCAKDSELNDLFKNCVDELAGFRTDHLKIVSEYILSQTKHVGPGSTGTGGTNPMIFLKNAQENTLDLL